MPNRIEQIADLGQSIWYDNIRRGILDSGELRQLVQSGVRGVTSNPTIFEKAIVSSPDYDAAIARGAHNRLSVQELYDDLVLEDIARGADVLRPVFDKTEGRDGFISIEVPPTLSADTQATITEAHRLVDRLKRPNIMIKVPATPEGIPAIEQLIADGIHINVTLIFDLGAYEQVMEAYIKGLERRLAKQLPIAHIASVASFFVSRVDSLVDRLITERHLPEELQGKTAIANAKLAYQLFTQKFKGERFDVLRQHGAQVQRPLWASTSTKNPNYPDLLYVDSLIGPDTVNTLPPATVGAVLDHAVVRRTVDTDVDDAHVHLTRLDQAGIDLSEVTHTLLREGLHSFRQSFVTLMDSLSTKLSQFAPTSSTVDSDLATHADVVQKGLDDISRKNVVARIWDRDASLWKSTEKERAVIANALGWLDVPKSLAEVLDGLPDFVSSARKDGFTHAVVLGMGGSSLVSDVISHAFAPSAEGLKLSILDSTHPQMVNAVKESLPLQHTLFIVASKSGTTTEPDAYFRYFWDIIAKTNPRPGEQFVAITDPETALHHQAHEMHFRHIFVNPADIGGRFSALSLFGLVPAALYGVDISALTAQALPMQASCRNDVVHENPGAWLGATLGTLAQNGLDKVTFIMPETISLLADWLEQLLAESTGKEGRGLIPVAHEPFLPTSSYGQDRIFIVYQLENGPSTPIPQIPKTLPRITITIPDAYALGGEFFRWEFAVAVAGSVLSINAFDQPNVQESKDNTRQLLDQYRATHSLGNDPADLPYKSLRLSPFGEDRDVPIDLSRVLSQLKPGDYVALMAYCAPNPDTDAQLAHLRQIIGTQYKVATTLGYGPRFLHSTGQEHKGGPNQGVFVQIVDPHGPTTPIPGMDVDFNTLVAAQSVGDFQALQAHHRKALRIICTASPQEGLSDLKTLLS